MRSVYRATTAAICAFLTGCALAQGVSTNGTMLADDLTSRSRVVVDAFENSSNRVHTLIETVSPRTSLEPSTNYTDEVAVNISNFVNSALSGKADNVRPFRVEGSIVVPERISGGIWSHAGDGAAADVGDLTYNSYFSEQEGVVVWTGTAPYTIIGEEGTFYTWAMAVYDAFGDTFVGYCSQGNGSADIEYDVGGMVSNSFTSVLGLSWKDSFATLNTPEPDALNWGNVEGIPMYSQITVSTSVTGVEHVVYSGELQSATNVVLNIITNETPARFTYWKLPSPFQDYHYATNSDWIAGRDYYTASFSFVPDDGGTWNVYCKTYLYDLNEGSWEDGVDYEKDIYAPSNTLSLTLEGFLGFQGQDVEATREYIPNKNSLGFAYEKDIPPPQDLSFTNDFPRWANTNKNALSIGTRVGTAAQGSFVSGNNNRASGTDSTSLGRNAVSTNAYSFTFNSSYSNYGSHGSGTFNVNTANGIYGFFIGDKTLYELLVESLSQTNSTTINYVYNSDDDDDEYSEETRTFSPPPILRQNDISPLQNSVNAMWATMYGESVWIAVTNYMRQIAGTVPSLRLWEVRDNTTNLVYSSAEEIEHITTQKVNAAKSEIKGMIPRTAWGSYQSSGEDNPSSNAVTVVNSPKIMLTGGGEWYRTIETGGRAIWVLKTNGMITLGGDTNGYFRVCDLEGNAQIEVVKTADQIVGAFASDHDFDGDGNFTVTFNASGSEHPKVSCALDLGDDFEEEDDSGNINSLGITVEWSKNGDGMWVATIHQDTHSPRLFVNGKRKVGGENLVRNNAPTALDGGIYINNVRYRIVPYSTGGKTYMTLEEWQ